MKTKEVKDDSIFHNFYLFLNKSFQFLEKVTFFENFTIVLFQKKKKKSKMQTKENKTKNEQNVDFPGFTQFITENFCCFKTHYIPKIEATFLGSWELNIIPPLLVFLASIASFVFSILFLFPTATEKAILIPLLSVFLIMFLISYFKIISEGPGYFPFFWGQSIGPQNLQSVSRTEDSIKDPINPYFNENENQENCDENDAEYLGIISSEDQYKWAEKQPKPPRTILSDTARRLVLRPDHLCKWAASWIGKRNQKFFILFNFYCVLYLIIFILFDIKAIVYQLEKENNNSALIFFYFVFGFIGALCLLLTISFLFLNIYDAIHNITQWEQWNNIDPKKFDRGFKLNWEDVFGPCNKWWTHFIPVSPWKGKNNTDISAGYISYFSIEQEHFGN